MIRQEPTTSQPWDGALQLCLLQAICHTVTVALATVNKSNIKNEKGKKRLWSQFVEIVKAREPFISELDTVNIKNWVS